MTQFNNVLGPGLGITRQQLAAQLQQKGARIIGRNVFRQPEWWDLDFRLAKMFNISHGMQLEVLAEVFNALNTRNKFVISANQNMFNAAYTANASGTTPGDRYTFTQTSTFRLQGGYDNCGGTVGTCPSDPRQLQLAAKIIF